MQLDFGKFALECVMTLCWALVASIAMSVALGVLLFVYDKMTPGVDEWAELKKGNLAVAIVMAAVILAFGFVVGMIVHGGSTSIP